MTEKLKSWILNDQIFYSLMVILVGVGSFALGQAATVSNLQTFPISGQLDKQSAAVSIRQSTTTENFNSTESVKAGEVVASKSGTKYHLKTCSGAKQIKAENLLTFSSISEAEAAGYKPAANCPGLE